MAFGSVTNSVYHDIKVLLKVFNLDSVMILASVTELPLISTMT